MNTYSTVGVAPHRFAFGYYRQVWWSWLIGSAFFLGEIGAGLFLVSLLTRYRLGLLLGYLIVVFGKNAAHIKYLGKPLRFWRAAMRPDRSWIARGIWATGFYSVTGFVVLLEQYWGLRLVAELDNLVWAVAGISALFIMFYDGFVMNSSAAIPFWNSRLLPLLCLTYAALGGVTLWLTLRTLAGAENGSTFHLLQKMEYGLLLFNCLLLLLYIVRMASWTPAAKATVRELLRGAYAKAFVGIVLVVGTGAALALSYLHATVHATPLTVLVAVSELVGDYTLVMVLLKAGLFSPQTALAYVDY